MRVFYYSILFCFVFSFSLSAAYKPGSECGLADSWESIQEVHTTFDLSKVLDLSKDNGKLERMVKRLPGIVKAQLVATAKAVSKEKIGHTVEAVRELKDKSEDQTLDILRAEVKGKKYSVVSTYFGGNHTGYIFPWGSTKPSASISDDDIKCLE